MHDLVTVANRHLEGFEHGVVRSIEERRKFRICASLDEIKSKKGH
jgi:hypothetical protein